MDLPLQRLRNQRLAGPPLDTPERVVAWLGAVQAQDYAGACWALALRMKKADGGAIERAFSAGRILRLHVLRPTWHFVTPADIRWLLALTAPRVRTLLAHYDRKLAIDRRTVDRGNAALARALEGGRTLTRAELAAVLGRTGIAAAGQRLAHLVMHAELDAVICSGPRCGKQFTYALLAERAPRARVLPRDEALPQLFRRYLAGHGPATLRDFGWWSGLTMADGRAAAAALGRELTHETIEGKSYWRLTANAGTGRTTSRGPIVHLLPNYDEHFVAYRDRDLVLPRERTGPLYEITFPHQIAIDGRLAGGWKRTVTARGVAVEARTFRTLTRPQVRALAGEVKRYGAFLGSPVALTLNSRPVAL